VVLHVLPLLLQRCAKPGLHPVTLDEALRPAPSANAINAAWPSRVPARTATDTSPHARSPPRGLAASCTTAACAPYRRSGRFAWHFARGKLGRDPVFRGMLERGDLPASARVVDIGCGQGLLASLLQACMRCMRGRPLARGLAGRLRHAPTPASS
jgi:hypothetical protein